jgi:CheY-like chemotaxis protein
LLAEDNEANRCSIANYLMAQKKNYRFLFAKEGQAAIALTQTQRPDLILLNIQMPDIQNDLEIIQTLKGGDRDFSPIPLIAMSAFATREDRDRCLAAGADDYIPKPVSLKPLATKIQQWFTPARPHTGEPPQSTSPTTREMHQKPRTTT